MSPAVDVRVLLRLADAAAKRGEMARALSLYEQVADEYEARGHYLKTVALLKQILNLGPDRPDLRFRLAEGFIELGLTGDARGELRRVIATAAGDRELHDKATTRFHALGTK